MASPTPLGIHQIAPGEKYALVADLNRVGVTADAAIAFVKARAEYLTDKAVTDAAALSRQALNALPGQVENEVDRVIGDTREDAAEALTVAQQAYEYNQTLVAPAAAVINAVVTDPATESGALVAGKVDKGAQVHNVMDYGAAADGVTDDSAALRDAVTAARMGRTPAQGSAALLVPAHATLYVNQVVDLRYIVDLRIEGRVVVGPSGTLIVGHASSQRPGQRIHIRDVRHADTSQTNAAVRIVGTKQAKITVLRCSNLELLADSTVSNATDGSISYCEITLGDIDRMAITCKGAGWITENNFYGGDITNLVVTGTDQTILNQNVFHKPCFEGGGIDWQVGSRNLLLNVRCEAGTTIKFGAQTARNVIVDNFTSNPANRAPGAVVTADLGAENIVTSAFDTYTVPVPLVCVDASSTTLDTARDVLGDAIIPGLDKLFSPAWRHVIDTGRFTVRDSIAGFGPDWYSRATMTRIELTSDAAIWRPTVTLYRADGTTVTTPGAMLTSGGWNVSGDSWVMGAAVASANVVITDPAVTHARIRVRPGSGGGAFRACRLVGYVPTPGAPIAADEIRRNNRRPLYQTTKPTQGAAHPGTRVEGPTGAWVCTNRVDTTSDQFRASGAGDLRLTSTAGISAGDVLGVVTTDGTTHWATVDNIASGVAYFTPTLATGVAPGAPVVAVRWVTR